MDFFQIDAHPRGSSQTDRKGEMGILVKIDSNGSKQIH